uniref:Uncharacterized protein n=1 Tax=Onchocerca volvulus TaxID=6282 RepID=A0A8R1TQ84_ONCVO
METHILFDRAEFKLKIYDCPIKYHPNSEKITSLTGLVKLIVCSKNYCVVDHVMQRNLTIPVQLLD